MRNCFDKVNGAFKSRANGLLHGHSRLLDHCTGPAPRGNQLKSNAHVALVIMASSKDLLAIKESAFTYIAKGGRRTSMSAIVQHAPSAASLILPSIAETPYSRC